MRELVGVTVGVDGRLWSVSHRKCVSAIHSDFWELWLGEGLDFPSSVFFYLQIIKSQYEAYSPCESYPISDKPRNALIHLIQKNPALAAFSFLTMYSTRHHTLKDHPDTFDNLFWCLPEPEKLSHHIGKPTNPPPSPLRLIKTHRGRGPIPIQPTHSNKISYSFHLEPTAGDVG